MPLTSLSRIVDNLSNVRVLCIGDVMLDAFIEGKVERISPEAPIPILHETHKTYALGGAGNVVRNLVTLGAEVDFLTIAGADWQGEMLQELLKKLSTQTSQVITEKHRPTTFKTRYLVNGQQLLRVDNEITTEISDLSKNRLLKHVKQCLPQCDLVILSDYGKGLFDEQTLQTIIKLSRDHKRPLFIDPKGQDFRKYKGASFITPNLKEVAEVTNMELKDEKAIVSAAEKIMKTCQTEAVIVTRGRDGITIVTQEGETHNIPTQAQQVFDVSGAGDTFIATIATSYAAGASLNQAAQLANVAAGCSLS